MNTKQKNIWKKIRQKGQFRFILLGTLLVALGGSFLSVLFDYGFEFFFNDEPNYMHESERFLSKILIRLVITLISGIYASYYFWNKNEEIFFKTAEEK